MHTPNPWIQNTPQYRELTEGDKYHVFISYRSVNRSWVLNLYDVLRSQGLEVFLDLCVLKPGDQLTTLGESLGASQNGILVWSSGSLDSEWVKREYNVMELQATQKPHFRFMPVKLDRSQLPPFAGTRIFLDFSNYPDGPNGGELLKLLYALADQPLSEEAAHFAHQQDEEAQKMTTKIRAAVRNGNGNRLISLFEEGGLPWQTSSALGCQSAEGLTQLARYDEAIEMLEKLEAQFPRAIRPKQLKALALARRGKNDDLDTAQEILGELYEEGERDPETLGIYARTWMDRYEQTQDISDLKQSQELYAEAFEGAQDDYYTGINAATKSLLLGTPEYLQKAADYAKRVQERIGSEPVPGDYWLTATVGEAFLLQKKYAEAAGLYEAAVAMSRREVGSHHSTWLQACRLMEKLQPSPEERAQIRKVFEHLPDCDGM